MQTNNIHSNAILVKISLGMPGLQRKDKALSEAVQQEHSLGADAGRYVKNLWPKDALAPIQKHDGATRSWVKFNTLRWPDDGLDLLPTAKHIWFTGEIGKRRMEREKLIAEHFMAGFDGWVEWAKNEHNGAFDPTLYDKDKVSADFSFDITYRPVPASSQFEASVRHLIGDSAQQLDEAVRAASEEARLDLWKRFRAPIEAMVERLKNPENKFKDTLVTNVQDIVEVLPTLNITGDTALDQLVADAKKLTEVAPDLLRHNKRIRSETAAQAEAMLKKMQSFV